MKAGWQSKPLVEVCQIKPPKAEARRLLTGTDLVSFVPMEDLGIERKVFTPTQKRSLNEVSGSYTYFADGDVLLAKITPCFENGKLGIAANLTNGVGFGSSEYIVFRPDKSLDKEWLYYFLSQESFRKENAERMSGAVGHKRVSKEYIESYPIPVPPLHDQQRIVGIIDEAFDGIATAKANAEKNLQNARALFESHLQSVFTQRGEGWDRTTIGEQVMLQRGFDITKNEQQEGSIPVVSSGGIKSYHNKAMAQAPGVVIGRKGTLGKAFYLETDFWPHDTTLWVKDFKGNNPRFVYYLFTGLDVKRLDSGTANPALNRNLVHPIEVYWPPTSRQKAIVEKLDKLSSETKRLESIYQQKLAALDALKKSLLDRAFTGAL